MILQIIGSFFAGLGFGVIFNIHDKRLLAAALGGTIGYTTYLVLTTNGVDAIMALFIASIVFSTYSEICARKFRAPVIAFLIIALIILVPGKGMYYTMLEVIQGNSGQALLTGINTLASAGALALGTIFVSSIVKLFFNKGR